MFRVSVIARVRIRVRVRPRSGFMVRSRSGAVMHGAVTPRADMNWAVTIYNRYFSSHPI